MAIPVDQVVVELEARLGRYTANVANAERHFDRSMRNIRGAAVATEARVGSAFRNMASAAGLTFGTAGAVLAAREFLRFADTAKNLEAQLRLATRESGNFAQAQEDVRRIAAETRSGLEETAQLYATFQRNSRELGITQAQAARATETVTKAFQISGASAAEAAGGLRQFLQGIQSGTLRGEELNSVLENAPRLARLIADSLGITIGQLRALGQEGQLAGDKLITALTDRRFTEQIDAEFRELPVTFDQAMTLINNAAIETFGAFDRGGRFSEAIVNFITQSTDGMADIAASAEQAGIDIRAAFEGLATAFDPLWQAASLVFGDLSGQAINLRNIVSDIGGLIDSLAGAGNFISNTISEAANRAVTMPFAPGMAAFGNPLLTGYGPRLNNYNPNARAGAEAAFDAAQARGQTDARARALGGSSRGGRSFGPQGFQRFINEPGRFDMLGNPIGAQARPTPAASGGSTRRRGGGGRGTSAETLARRAEAERLRQEREDQAFRDELASLNEDLIAARQSMVTAAEAVAAFEVQEIEAARDRQNAAYKAAITQGQLSQKQAEQLVAANDAVAAERTRAVQLREQRRIAEETVQLASSELDNAIELEQAQGALARTNEERRDSALRLLDHQKEQERLELQAIVQLHGLNDIRGKEAQARLDILDTLYSARRQGVMDQNMSERDRYLRDIRDAGETINEQADRVAVDGLEALNDGLVDAIMGTKSLGEVFKNVANQIIADLLRIAIQQAIIRPLGEALFGAGGGKSGGGFLSSIGSFFSSVFNSGGGGGGMGGLKPFASGGSILLGGRGGIDGNVLSLNGSPLGMVSRGERLDIVPQGKALSGVGGAARLGAGGGGPPITIIVNAQDAVLSRTVRTWVREGVEEATGRGASQGAGMVARRFGRQARNTL